MKKRFVSLILSLALFLVPSALVFPVYAEESPEAPSAESTEETSADTETPPDDKPDRSQGDTNVEFARAACVYNLENDRVIFEKNAYAQVYPVSVAKMVTALVALDVLKNDMDREVEITAEMLSVLSGYNIGLRRGEILTVEQLLYALICGGANDAAIALAFEISGNLGEFSKLMNEHVRALGAEHSNFTNPTGMHDPMMVTTVHDTLLIAAEAAQNEFFVEVSSLEQFSIPPTNRVSSTRIVYNKNYYFATNVEYLYRWSVPQGLNAGYTPEGGYCVVTSAVRDGLTYIVVVMDAIEDEDYIYSYVEAADLVKWAFNAYGYAKVLTTSDMICEVPVKLASKVDYVTLFPSENIELYLPVDVDVQRDVALAWEVFDKSFVAPLSEGQVVGRLTVTFQGGVLGEYDLIIRNNVNRNNLLYVLDILKGIIANRHIAALLLILLAAAVIYLIAVIAVSRRRRKEREAALAMEKARAARSLSGSGTAKQTSGAGPSQFAMGRNSAAEKRRGMQSGSGVSPNRSAGNGQTGSRNSAAGQTGRSPSSAQSGSRNPASGYASRTSGSPSSPARSPSYPPRPQNGRTVPQQDPRKRP